MENKVYDESNNALDTLSSTWEVTLALLRAIAEASNNSLRAEPDLMQLQKHRKELDALLEKLKTQATWLQDNKNKVGRKEGENETSPELNQALEEQRALRQVKEKCDPSLLRKEEQKKSVLLNFIYDFFLFVAGINQAF